MQWCLLEVFYMCTLHSASHITPAAYQHTFFYGPDAFPAAQPTLEFTYLFTLE